MNTFTLSTSNFSAPRTFARTSRTFTIAALLTVVPAGIVGCSGATTPTAMIQDVVAGVDDAGIVLQQVQSYVTVYFQTHTDPASVALAAKVQAVLTDARNALDAVVKAGAVATDISDANLQSAIADFSTAFASVVTLATQIGVQVSGAAPAPAATANAATNAPKLVVSEPMLLRRVKPSVRK